MIKKYRIIVFLILSMVLLSSCSNILSPDNSTEQNNNSITNSDTTETNSDTTETKSEKFLENFSQDYPDFELLNYVVASDENYPIILAGIAENKENGSSSTLFIVDDNGVGQVVLASGYFAIYRKEDGLFLNENVIALSLDLVIPDENYEIHDFEITVSQKENQGKIDTLYSSKEVIREN